MRVFHYRSLPTVKNYHNLINFSSSFSPKLDSYDFYVHTQFFPASHLTILMDESINRVKSIHELLITDSIDNIDTAIIPPLCVHFSSFFSPLSLRSAQAQAQRL